MRRRVAPICCASILMLAPVLARGQTIRGRVVDGADRRPLSGTLVELRDSTGHSLQTVFTSPSGLFLVSAPGPGRYSVRFAAIGFAPPGPSSVDVGTEGVVLPDLVLARYVVALKAIVALGAKPFCGKSGMSDETFGQLLDGARTSLQVMEATVRDQSLGFVVRTVSRQAIKKGRDSSVAADTTLAPLLSWPIKSADVDSLRITGFGRAMRPGEGTGRVYYGPDVSVLFSDWFFENHCFTLDKKDAKSDTLHLKFEPRSSSKKQVEISGELVLDRETLTLHRLTFRHQDLPAGLKDGSAGGEIEFAQRPSGLWVPTNWAIWAPVVKLERVISRPSFGPIGSSRTVIGPSPQASSAIVATAIGREERRGVVTRASRESHARSASFRTRLHCPRHARAPDWRFCSRMPYAAASSCWISPGPSAGRGSHHLSSFRLPMAGQRSRSTTRRPRRRWRHCLLKALRSGRHA